MKARVKWFNDSKGYGFLSTIEKEPRDVFVYYTDIQGGGFLTLYEDQIVDVTVEETPTGPKARNVIRGSCS